MSKIPRRASRYQPSGWLRGVVMGLDDGLVTTLIAVFALSHATPHLFLVLSGVVLAGSVSMALGGYASAKFSYDAYPMLQGLETGCAFLVGGIFPLLPVALQLPYMQFWSYCCAAIVALAFGVIKARWADKSHDVILSALFFLGNVSAGTAAGLLVSLVLH